MQVLKILDLLKLGSTSVSRYFAPPSPTPYYSKATKSDILPRGHPGPRHVWGEQPRRGGHGTTPPTSTHQGLAGEEFIPAVQASPFPPSCRNVSPNTLCALPAAPVLGTRYPVHARPLKAFGSTIERCWRWTHPSLHPRLQSLNVVSPPLLLNGQIKSPSLLG